MEVYSKNDKNHYLGNVIAGVFYPEDYIVKFDYIKETYTLCASELADIFSTRCRWICIQSNRPYPISFNTSDWLTNGTYNSEDNSFSLEEKYSRYCSLGKIKSPVSKYIRYITNPPFLGRLRLE